MTALKKTKFTVSLHQGFRLACLMMLPISVTNSYALGTATPTDIPGVQILDAHVSADYVNNITVGSAGNPPFAPGTEVNKLKTTQPFIAIRSYYTPYDSSKSGQAGGWVSPIAEARGISRAELLEKLALPINPDGTRNNTFALVMVPSGVSFWSGPAGPITSSKTPPVGSYWGAGGGIQYYVGRNAGDVPGFQVPIKNYVLAAPMGETNLLAYSPSLRGNALRVGQYLDELPVQAYSDLDRVLTTLDMINLSSPAGDQKLQQAIGQLGAERYGALGLASLYQGQLFMDRMSDFSGNLNFSGGGASAVSDVGNLTWMQTQGASAKQASDSDRTGFTQKTKMLVAGTETKLAENWKLGVAAAYFSSTLDWANSAPGDGELKTGYMGGYATYQADDLRVTGQAFLGYSHIETRRNISIPDAGLWPGYSFAINRVAKGSTEVKASGIRLDITHMVTLGQTKLAPFIGVDYQHFVRGQFAETGAGSIDLQVQSKSIDDLRLRLGISANQAMGSSGTLDWFLHGHVITAPRISGSSGELVASLGAQNSSFSANAWRSPAVLNQAGIGMTGRGKNADLTLNYNYEQGSGFAASTFTLSADWRF